jgi:hypothetical protein
MTPTSSLPALKPSSREVREDLLRDKIKNEAESTNTCLQRPPAFLFSLKEPARSETMIYLSLLLVTGW